MVNVFGMGIVDDKVIYVYVFKMIEFYLGELIIIFNVLIYVCINDEDC